MLRTLGVLVAAPALVLTAPAIAADPTAKPILVELGGKPVGYALAVAPVDRAKVCGAKKLRLRLGTNMAPALAAWLGAPAQQGPSPTASVYLAGGAQKLTIEGARAVRVELPIADAKSNARSFFLVELEAQSTTCGAVPSKEATATDKQAVAWAARATTASTTRVQLAGKPLAGVRTTGVYAPGGLGNAQAEFAPSEAEAILEWMVRVNDRKTVELQETLVDGAGASVLEILARVQEPSANGRKLELKSDHVQICVFVDGQRLCLPAAPAPTK
ncbi:MAG: hypothetical protein HOO96_01665 [Polyangiaceae bacterium]|nr:hypothetical protein [Polyangiaceae bacterium]